MNSYVVSIVIPNFNGEDLFAKNLQTVKDALKNSVNKIKEVIIVDDASTDNSVKFVKSNFPMFKIIKHKVNRGFASAVNTGVRSAKGNLIVLLNTDVIPEHDFLKSVFSNFDDEKTFAVSLHEKDFGPANCKFLNGYFELSMFPEGNKVVRSFYVSGGSGVFRKKYWLELSGMDEKLMSPFYWEDFDLCYRAMKRGFVNLWDPSAKVNHLHESTIGKLSQKYVGRIRERNQLLVIWKNINSGALTRKHIAGVISRILKHPKYTLIVLMALSKLTVVLRLRQKELKESLLSDEAVFEKFYD